MRKTIIGVDLGGTQVRAARLDDNLNILKREAQLTLAHEGKDATIQRIKDLTHRVMPEDKNVEGIGISCPGPLNPWAGVVVSPPNLHGWHNVPIGQILSDEFGVPVYVGNDANVAVLAEELKGAAQGARNAVYITVSTGIGGGVIVDGKLLLGEHGLGAELGHIPLVVDGDTVSSLEKEAAGPSLARKARLSIEAGANSSISEAVNGDLTKIDGRVVGEAAMSGDPLAVKIVKRGGWMVGLGIVTLLHLFNPQVVVVGGGVSKVGGLLFEPMWEAVQAHVIDPAYWEDLRLERAALGDDVSIVGAGTLVVTQGGTRDIEEVFAEID